MKTSRAFRRPCNGCCRGFTLLELMLALIVVATLAVIAVSAYSSYMEKAQVSQAEEDLTSIEARIALYQATNGELPTSLAQVDDGTMLDPWGHPYYYLDFTGLKNLGEVRKDQNLVPINSDYDLYSAGANGATLPEIAVPASQDDVIRANNGGFIGLASDY